MLVHTNSIVLRKYSKISSKCSVIAHKLPILTHSNDDSDLYKWTLTPTPTPDKNAKQTHADSDSRLVSDRLPWPSLQIAASVSLKQKCPEQRSARHAWLENSSAQRRGGQARYAVCLEASARRSRG